jgi:hypothetical protein
MSESITGILWYRPEDYLKCRKLFTDGNVLPETYKGWLAEAEKVEKKLKGDGITVLRVLLDPNTFPAWCLVKGMKLDAQARSAFASEMASKAYAKSNLDFNP